MSLTPGTPPSLLEKNPSSVSGTHIGASCADTDSGLQHRYDVLSDILIGVGTFTSAVVIQKLWWCAHLSLSSLFGGGSELMRERDKDGIRTILMQGTGYAGVWDWI